MKYSTLFLLIILAAFAVYSQPQQRLFYRAPVKPKCRERVLQFLSSQDTMEETMKVWVFFTDKGVNSKGEFTRALVESRAAFPQRTLRRRAKVRSRDNLVDYQDLHVSLQYITRVLQSGAKHRATSRWLNAISVEATRLQIQQIEKLPFVSEIRKVAGFKYKESEYKPDSFSKARSLHKQSGFKLDYGRSFAQLEQMRVPILHQLGYSGKGVLLCMLDTGFYKEHESFQHLHIVAEHDFVFNDDDTQTDPNNPNDSSDQHGTLTLSTVAGFKEGKLIGPAFGVDVILAKTEDTRSETSIEEDYWVEGIEWADSLGADVVSSSLAYDNWYTFSDFDGNTALTTRAADRAASLGIVVVNAAGNFRGTTGHIAAPADGDSVIAVGAVDSTGLLAYFSSPGPTYDGRIKPDVCAQGVNTRCAGGGMVFVRAPNGYGSASGTSLSTPLVAGVAALLLEIHPDWTPWDVISALRNTASRASHPDNDYGWGIVDAFRAADLSVPYVIFTAYTVDDDSIGASLGNGNGTAEPGEQVELEVAVTNLSARAVSEDAEAVLATDDPYVDFIQAQVHLGNVMPNDSVYTPAPFVFRVSPAAPDSHIVAFHLSVTDQTGNLANSWFKLLLIENFRIAGHVTAAGSGIGVQDANLFVRGPLGKDGRILSEKTHSDRTTLTGGYGFLLPDGRYAVQPRASGFLLPDAKIISVPPESLNVDFDLSSPILNVDQDSVVITATLNETADRTITLTNSGSGELYFTIFESPAQNAFESINNPEFDLAKRNISHWDAPEAFTQNAKLAPPPVDSLWQPLYHSPDDGTQLCTKGCYVQSNDDYIYLKIAGYRNWGNPNDWELDFLLDTDANAKTGDDSYAVIGAEYLISIGARGNVLLQWTGQEYKFVSFLSYAKVTGDVCELGVQDSQLGISCSNAGQVNIEAVLLENREGGEKILRDIMPDDGGLSFIPFSLFKSGWLDVAPSWGVLQAGQSQQVHIHVDVSQLSYGSYRSFLLTASNQVAGTLKYIPVVLNVTTGISGQENGRLPKSFKLYPNNPNPFNAGTTINYAISKPGRIRLEIFNVLGQKVVTLVDEHKPAGYYTFLWNGKNTLGQEIPAGVYFCRMFAGGDFMKTQKMIMLP